MSIPTYGASVLNTHTVFFVSSGGHTDRKQHRGRRARRAAFYWRAKCERLMFRVAKGTLAMDELEAAQEEALLQGVAWLRQAPMGRWQRISLGTVHPLRTPKEEWDRLVAEATVGPLDTVERSS
jgi:hypothetical protein